MKRFRDMKESIFLLWLAIVGSAYAENDCDVNVFEDCKDKCLFYRRDEVTGCSTCDCIIVGDGKPKLFEGDIRVDNKSEKNLMATVNSNGKLKAISTVYTRWTDYPNGDTYEIPYILDPSLPTAAINAINSAIAQFDADTCLRLVERGSQQHYLKFFQGTGCWSYVGRLDGESELSIGAGCEIKGIVIHEIMHSLAFFHEQSRPDRDQYVTIVTANIQTDRIGNFQKYSSSVINSRGSPYDYTSVMHYGPTAFSVDGSATITKANGEPLTETQIVTFAQSDLNQINSLYCSSNSGKNKASYHVLLLLPVLFERFLM